MSGFGYFWNSRNGDRKYNADSFSDMFRKFYSIGVFRGELEVTSIGGMRISVSPGFANINGKVMFFETSTVFSIGVAYTSSSRIDSVVVERNDTDRAFTLKVVKGGTDGSAPAPIRQDGVYQLVIAHVSVAAGAVAITQADITDTRGEEDLCGYVYSVGTEPYNPSWVFKVLSGGSWNNSDQSYSFESIYPSSTYDILEIVPSEYTTDAQRKAWAAADCGGYYSTNKIVAHQVKPTIDIPVAMYIRKKVI